MLHDEDPALRWKPDELVVDTRYLEPVEDRLRKLRVEVANARDDIDSDPNLGLTLLRNLQQMTSSGCLKPLVDLDAVLADLRYGFAAENDGWVPEMGKNRLSDVVFPSPNPDIHLDTLPVSESRPGWADLLDGPAADRRLEVRRKEPVRVGVVDTTLVPHETMIGVEEKGVKWHEKHPVPMRAGHARFVAGLIRKQAPAATIILRPAMGSTGTGTLWTAAQQISAFASDKVDVLNLSMGCRTADGQPPLAISRAIAQIGPDTVVVASAGNHGDVVGMVDGVTRKSPVWPAALPGVVAVGAIDENEKLASFSPDLPWIDHLECGVDVISSYISAPEVDLGDGTLRPFKGWARWSGTSFAAANLTGRIAGLMASNNGLSALEALSQICKMHPIPNRWSSIMRRR